MSGIKTKFLHGAQIAAPLLALPFAAHAQVVGTTPVAMLQSAYTATTTAFGVLGGIAGFVAAGHVWGGYHNWWHAAIGVLGGAALGMVGGVLGAATGG